MTGPVLWPLLAWPGAWAHATALLPWLAAAGAAGGWCGAAWRARGRRELVLRAVHEVRGPLTAASLALHFARRSGGERAAALSSVEGELRRAARLLEDVTAAGRGRRPTDCPAAVPVGPLLRAQAQTWRPVAWSVGGDVRVAAGSADVSVVADPVRLRQATANLIANALEHGGPAVTVGAVADGDRVRIEVGDSGTGPEPAARGARRRRRRRTRDGRGRGLAIVADIAARQGGRLLTDTDADGARMTVELPRTRADR